VSLGLETASRPGVRLIVCEASASSLADLRRGVVPCPVVLRHDLTRQAIDVLYDAAWLDADIRPSFREYDDLRLRLSAAPVDDDLNATRAILRGLAGGSEEELRRFTGVMAILGERPVMQADVAGALGKSTSSLRSWLSTVRRERSALPSFPGLNAHFVALHFVWRRERLRWPSRRAAAAAGFLDDRACASYLRYHVGQSAAQLLRAGGFDAQLSTVRRLFSIG
jgi:hypothetical protein